MKRRVFHSDKAPPPKGPYSQAILHDELLYISGQGPVKPTTGSIVQGTIEEETRITLNNLKIIIEEAGYTLEGVLKVTCDLSSMDDFEIEIAGNRSAATLSAMPFFDPGDFLTKGNYLL